MKPKILLVFLMQLEEASRMLQGVVKYERSHRQWATFLDDEARAQRDPDWLRREQWHGVISRNTSPLMVETCAQLGIPLVDLNDTPPFPGVPKIRPDNTAIGHQGAEYFLDRGFRHFAFCGFSNEPWSCERRDGFREALQLAGHPCEVMDVPYSGVITPEWNGTQIAELATWLRRLPKPIGILGCVDVRGFQLLSAAHSAGLLVPEEVAVLGVNNDTTRCELSYPPLASVALNCIESGYIAAETLDRMLRGEEPGSMDLRVEPLGVVPRLSADIFAVGDRIVASALSYIRENACKGMNVDDLLPHLHATRSQLEKRFRRAIGRSPQAEIRRVQLTRVKELLLETDFPLKTISAMTGFEHLEYLSVVFKRETSETPGQFRKRTQAKHDTRNGLA